MSAPRFERVAVLGLGLLGGSVALAARARGIAATVVGAGRRRAPLEHALSAGVVDEIASPLEAVAGADLVVLGSPVPAMPALIEAVAPGLAAGTLITDVGSVKQCLVDTLPGLLPDGVHYVGAHPMAGSHLKGVEHARADLFEGACCVVTPGAATIESARDRIVAFWQGLGARVELRTANEHDAEVAWVSHLPHALAFAFARSLADAPSGAAALAGTGFRDFTRIAHSDPDLWAEILVENRKSLSATLQSASQHLRELASVVEQGDTHTVERFLASARDHLAAVDGAKSHPDDADLEGGD